MWNDRTVNVRDCMIRKRLKRIWKNQLPVAPGPQEHHENVEFLGEALRGLPKPKTVFDCIGKDGNISDEGWGLLDLDNPHTR